MEDESIFDSFDLDDIDAVTLTGGSVKDEENKNLQFTSKPELPLASDSIAQRYSKSPPHSSSFGTKITAASSSATTSHLPAINKFSRKFIVFDFVIFLFKLQIFRKITRR